jgi:hypothetical protein
VRAEEVAFGTGAHTACLWCWSWRSLWRSLWRSYAAALARAIDGGTSVHPVSDGAQTASASLHDRLAEG